jgi:hypothetical protein
MPVNIGFRQSGRAGTGERLELTHNAAVFKESHSTGWLVIASGRLAASYRNSRFQAT